MMLIKFFFDISGSRDSDIPASWDCVIPVFRMCAFLSYYHWAVGQHGVSLDALDADIVVGHGEADDEACTSLEIRADLCAVEDKCVVGVGGYHRVIEYHMLAGAVLCANGLRLFVSVVGLVEIGIRLSAEIHRVHLCFVLNLCSLLLAPLDRAQKQPKVVILQVRDNKKAT